MPHVADLRRGQIVGDASRRWVDLNTLTAGYIAATYAPIASPTFTGDPKAPTPAPGDNDTSVATTAFVHSAVAAGAGINQLTGDATAGPGSGSQALTLAAVLASPGTYNNVTVNAKGLATAGSNVAYLTGNQTIALSGDVSGSGATAITATLATVNTNVGTFQGLTVNGKGLVTAAVNQNYLQTTTAAATYLPLTGGTINPGPLTLNANAAAPPPPPSGRNTGLQVSGANAATPTVLLDAFGGGAGAVPVLSGRQARGTAAAPTAIQSGDILLYLEGTGRVSGSAYAAHESAVFQVTAAENFTPAANGTYVSIAATRRGTATLGQVAAFDADLGCQHLGTQTNDNAPAGYVGEFMTNTASGVALTTSVSATICSITLTPGDWNVWGTVSIAPSGVTVTNMIVGLTGFTGSAASNVQLGGPAMGGCTLPPAMQRVSIAANTTVSAFAFAAFASGTCTAGGSIYARRVR